MISPQEIKKIAKFIKDNEIKPHNRQSVMLPYIDICPFLDKDNSCSIYEVRPAICRRYKCYENPKEDLDYRDLNIVNMLKTFYPQEYCPHVELKGLIEKFEKNKKRMFGGV